MSNSLMHRLAKQAGYCCLTEMLRSNELLQNQELAARLGVAKSTVSYWTNLSAAGILPYCPKCPDPRADRRPLKARSRGGGIPAP